MPEGSIVWQNDLLESRARSRGDVIFSGGVGEKMRINLASERRGVGGGVLTTWPSHHTMLVWLGRWKEVYS